MRPDFKRSAEKNIKKLTHLTVGYGAFGLAKEYQLVMMYHNYMQQNPHTLPPVQLELHSYNEGDDDQRGPAYFLNTPNMILNFPASSVDPADRQKMDQGALTMDMMRAREAGDFCNWVEQQRAICESDEMKRQTQSCQRHYETLKCKGFDEVQISGEMSYERYKLAMLSQRNEDGTPVWDWHSYFPRAMYGEYLEDRRQRARSLVDEINAHYQKTCATQPLAKKDILNNRAVSVDEVLDANGDHSSFTVTSTESGQTYTQDVDLLTIATGHQYNELFLPHEIRAQMFETGRFADSPYHDTEVMEILDATDGDLHIGGAGASSLDVYRAAAVWEGRTGKKVNLHMITPNPYVKVWGFDIRKDDNMDGGVVLAETLVAEIEALPAEDKLQKAMDALTNVIHGQDAQDIGPQNVFVSLKEERLQKRLKAVIDVKDWPMFEKTLRAYENSKTSPSSYQAFRKFWKSGQLDFTAGRIDGANLRATAEGIEVPLSDGRKIQTKGFADCFSLANAPFYVIRDLEAVTENIRSKTLMFDTGASDNDYDADMICLYVPDPFIRDALKKNILKPDLKKGCVNPAPRLKGVVSVTGAAAGRDRGVPYSVELIKDGEFTFERACQIGAQQPNDFRGRSMTP